MNPREEKVYYIGAVIGLLIGIIGGFMLGYSSHSPSQSSNVNMTEQVIGIAQQCIQRLNESNASTKSCLDSANILLERNKQLITPASVKICIHEYGTIQSISNGKCLASDTYGTTVTIPVNNYE